MTPTLVRVWHQSRRWEPEPKLVGKIFDIPVQTRGEPSEHRMVPIFYHGTTKHSQYHINTDCPGGIDAIVVERLMREEIGEVHQYIDGALYVAPTEAVKMAPRLLYDGRDRFYLPYAGWVRMDRWYEEPRNIPDERAIVLGTAEWAADLRERSR
jgi:hypothetical protein